MKTRRVYEFDTHADAVAALNLAEGVEGSAGVGFFFFGPAGQLTLSGTQDQLDAIEVRWVEQKVKFK